MPPGASSLSELMQTNGKRAVHTDDTESAVLKRYLRDVRRFTLLSRERERALGKQIQESRNQWRHLLLEHLLHVPLLLAWWPRMNCGKRVSSAQCWKLEIARGAETGRFGTAARSASQMGLSRIVTGRRVSTSTRAQHGFPQFIEGFSVTAKNLGFRSRWRSILHVLH